MEHKPAKMSGFWMSDICAFPKKWLKCQQWICKLFTFFEEDLQRFYLDDGLSIGGEDAIYVYVIFEHCGYSEYK